MVSKALHSPLTLSHGRACAPVMLSILAHLLASMGMPVRGSAQDAVDIEAEMCLLSDPFGAVVANQFRPIVDSSRQAIIDRTLESGLPLDTAEAPALGAVKECRVPLAADESVLELIPQSTAFGLISIRFLVNSQHISLEEAGFDSVSLALIIPAAVRRDSIIRIDRQIGDWREFPIPPIWFREVGVPFDAILAVTAYFGKSGQKKNEVGYVRKSDLFTVEACGVEIEARTCSKPLTRRGGRQSPSISNDEQIVITFKDRNDGRPIKSDRVGFDSLHLSVASTNERIEEIRRREIDPTDSILVGLRRLDEFSNGTVLRLDIWTKSEPQTSVYLRVRREWQSYGIAGIWLPVGMFSTNFKSGRTAEGLAFAPSPIGLSWGKKRYTGPNENSYFGFSVIASWQFLPASDDDEDTAGSYNLRGLTTGVLFDLYDYGYVGLAYATDLGKGSEDPGAVLLLGVGPTLERVLKLLSDPQSQKN